MTKLHKILIQRGMTQRELRQLVLDKTGYEIQIYRISKIVTGQITNYFTDTAKAIANALDVTIDEILE
jgi:transcriptional regulator with XRE-family HTH domain